MLKDILEQLEEIYNELEDAYNALPDNSDNNDGMYFVDSAKSMVEERRIEIEEKISTLPTWHEESNDGEGRLKGKN